MTAVERLRAYRARARERGYCQICCCQPVKPGCRTCIKCLARSDEHRDRLRAQGRCPCGRLPAAGKRTCAVCLARKRALYVARKEQAR
jgi:hypothetical protein